MKPFSIFFSAGLIALLVACSGGSDTGTITSSSSSSGSGGSSSKRPTEDESPADETDPTEPTGEKNNAPSKPSGATSVTCTTADDCGNWFCDCKDSSGRISPVNSADCNNGYCMDAATSCPKACSAFGKTWVGTAGGGP